MIVPATLLALAGLAVAHAGSHESSSLSARASHFNFDWAPPAWAVPPVNPQWSQDLLKNYNTTTPGPLENVCTGPVWGLTYDDGPSDYTDALLNHLAAKNIKATFMVIGSNVLYRPDVLLKTYQAGHQIGIHTWSHAAMSTLTVDQQIAELVNTAKIIKQVIGVVPTVWRPPYYAVDEKVLKVAATLGLRTVVWSLDSQDWALPWGGQTAQGIYDQFNTTANSGWKNPISLEHDGFQDSAAVAPGVVDILVAAGVKVATLNECLGMKGPYGGPLDAYLQKCSSDFNQWLGDNNNCGVCGNSCGSDGYCNKRQCWCNLNAGYMGDNNNCGGCGKKCPKNTTCKSNTCT